MRRLNCAKSSAKFPQCIRFYRESLLKPRWGDGSRFLLLLRVLDIRGQCSVLGFFSQGHELPMKPLTYQITLTAPRKQHTHVTPNGEFDTYTLTHTTHTLGQVQAEGYSHSRQPMHCLTE